MRRLLDSLIILTLLAASPAAAQQEPPARVGRVSFVSGNLAFHMAGETQWSVAGVNYPVATGASLWTDPEARAEIRIGSNTIDIAGGTEFDVTNLTEQITQIGVPQGRIHLRLRQLDAGHSVEIDIPRGSVRLLRPGDYDLDAGTADQPARVAVFEGGARFAGGGADIEIKAGDAAVLNGLGPVTGTLERAVADAFVEWCRSRDYDAKRLAAPYHVSPQMTGYAELDSSGRWDTVPGYGTVWYPNVPQGWAPYSEGRWISVAPWGWTWVDAAPWGFAPSHYGRWAFVGENWCWVPGSFEPSPVYAPALVGFLGGAGVGVYVSGTVGPQVGWFPLAPGETYWPGYSADPSYIRRINHANAGNIDDIQMTRNVMLPARIANAQFANRRFATVVPQHVFATAGNIGQAALHPPTSALEHAPVTMRPPQIRAASARSLSDPAAFGRPGQSGPALARQGEHPGGPGGLPAASSAALPPHPETVHEGRQPRRPANTAALPPPWHPGGAPPHGGTTAPPQVQAVQERQPGGTGAAHPRAPAPVIHPPASAFHAPAQAFHPPAPASHPPAQAFHPPAQAFHPPAQAFHPPAQAFHPPAPASHPPAQAFHPPAPAFHPQAPAVHPPQQVANAPPAPKGGGAAAPAPKGGGPAPANGGGGKGEKAGGKGDKHG